MASWARVAAVLYLLLRPTPMAPYAVSSPENRPFKACGVAFYLVPIQRVNVGVFCIRDADQDIEPCGRLLWYRFSFVLGVGDDGPGATVPVLPSGLRYWHRDLQQRSWYIVSFYCPLQ